ncbi:hypothetical protein PG993_005780 [Apiospora rasikravindrae]|uniref:Saccharopine dehydrogenase NADP binding domain-containing protein n=1 Tax=Apiospora rasikravindrae TaxID=990691 RepID=A0ABR1T9Q9_9PEZI
MSRLMIYGASANKPKPSASLSSSPAGHGPSSPPLAASLAAAYRVFELDDPSMVVSALKEAEIKVLLNCAGPFALTVAPLIAACIEAGVHYLDVSAELETYQLAADRSDDARAADVMLLPGCGGSVAMLGCLAGHALRRVKNPTHIDIALRVAGPMSRGSIVSAAQGSMMNGGAVALQRRGGGLVPWLSEKTGEEGEASGQFDFDDGEGVVPCFPVTLPDLFTIWKSTGVANIRTYACVTASGNMAFPEDSNNMLPDGPSAEEREANPYHAAVVVTGPDGSVGRAVLHTVNGYTFTAMASAQAARRVLEGEFSAGLQMPAMLFGNEFVETIAGSRLVDLHT